MKSFIWIVWCINNIATNSTHLEHKFTWSVVKCLSLKASSTYRSTQDVFPTQPSPSKTILKLYVLDAPLLILDAIVVYI